LVMPAVCLVNDYIKLFFFTIAFLAVLKHGKSATVLIRCSTTEKVAISLWTLGPNKR
jgi:invasion protein IalB